MASSWTRLLLTSRKIIFQIINLKLKFSFLFYFFNLYSKKKSLFQIQILSILNPCSQAIYFLPKTINTNFCHLMIVASFFSYHTNIYKSLIFITRGNTTFLLTVRLTLTLPSFYDYTI